jgi:signal transduction histidine kinase
MADFIFADDYRLDEGSTRSFYETFLKGFVHKHNNLMGVIQGFSSLILYDEGISGEVRDSAQQMQDSSKMASDLNREVLGAAGCGRCEIGSVNLSDVIGYWEGKAKEICDAAGVPLHFTARDGLVPIAGDSGKLSEIFSHLLSNAAEAAADVSGGSVAIDLFPSGEASPGDNVDLFIRNSSVEVSPDMVAKAYEPFHTTKGSEHFGLGLTGAAVLAGQMKQRLGLRFADSTMTAWLAMPPA